MKSFLCRFTFGKSKEIHLSTTFPELQLVVKHNYMPHEVSNICIDYGNKPITDIEVINFYIFVILQLYSVLAEILYSIIFHGLYVNQRNWFLQSIEKFVFTAF